MYMLHPGSIPKMYCIHHMRYISCTEFIPDTLHCTMHCVVPHNTAPYRAPLCCTLLHAAGLCLGPRECLGLELTLPPLLVERMVRGV